MLTHEEKRFTEFERLTDMLIQKLEDTITEEIHTHYNSEIDHLLLSAVVVNTLNTLEESLYERLSDSYVEFQNDIE